MDTPDDVFNQPAPLVDYNLFDTHWALQDQVRFLDPALDTSPLQALGARLGGADMQVHASLANAWPPVLRTHDRFGRRIDEVEFHPSYHVLLAVAAQAGLQGAPWAPGGSHLRRAAGFLLFSELEPAVLCPISMTYAAAPALRPNEAVHAQWAPGLAARAYDPSSQPWRAKAGLTMGMAMTERQGGSDLRTNATRAEPDGRDDWGPRYRLHGDKWFFSAPMSDAHLVLAQAPGGPTCFFLPRLLPDGTRNGVQLVRLKDKVGNRANATAEAEFHGSMAWRIGEEGRGIPQILEMGALTRLDCALGTSGLMRQALAQALSHARQRKAFGKALLAQPLMRNVLADLALEAEAASALSLRIAAALDRPGDAHEAAVSRLLTPVAKFWICKRGAAFAQEAMECLGGNGYVEAGGEGVLARIYREMPVNSIWEGSGNLMALDLLRALRQADAGAALARELAPARGAHPLLDEAIARLPDRIEAGATDEQARRLAQELALAVQATLLWQYAPAEVAQAFTVSRLGPGPGLAWGMLPPGTPLDALLARAMPT